MLPRNCRYSQANGGCASSPDLVATLGTREWRSTVGRFLLQTVVDNDSLPCGFEAVPWS